MPAAQRRRFPGIDASVLQHPYDRAALNALQKIPGLDIVVRKFIELFPEKVAYILNVSQTVKVSRIQCPQLYTQLQEACAILDVPEPELYVQNSPVPNAGTSGHTKPYIIVTTALLDLLNEDEVLAVIAHELGHIKSGHVLYKTMARIIGFLMTMLSDMTLGIGRIVGGGLQAALLEWDRMSEFSADRASLLAVQDSQVVLTLMMKLAGGTLFQKDEMIPSEFLKQADLYEQINVNVLDRVYKTLITTSATHPLIVVRAREAVKWAETPEYKAIMDGRYARTARTTTHRNNGNRRTSSSTPPPATETSLITCPHCGHEQANKRFCSVCGGAIS